MSDAGSFFNGFGFVEIPTALTGSGTVCQVIQTLQPEQPGRMFPSCGNLLRLMERFGTPHETRVHAAAVGFRVTASFAMGERTHLVHEFTGPVGLYEFSRSLVSTFFGAMGMAPEQVERVFLLKPGETLTIPGPATFDSSCPDEDLEG